MTIERVVEARIRLRVTGVWVNDGEETMAVGSAVDLSAEA